jgi:hypothetical protein
VLEQNIGTTGRDGRKRPAGRASRDDEQPTPVRGPRSSPSSREEPGEAGRPANERSATRRAWPPAPRNAARARTSEGAASAVVGRLERPENAHPDNTARAAHTRGGRPAAGTASRRPPSREPHTRRARTVRARTARRPYRLRCPSPTERGPHRSRPAYRPPDEGRLAPASLSVGRMQDRLIAPFGYAPSPSRKTWRRAVTISEPRWQAAASPDRHGVLECFRRGAGTARYVLATSGWGIAQEPLQRSRQT